MDNAIVTENPVFEAWPKIARYSRECVVTEKIDGTNAQVIVMADGRVFAGSRTRIIAPEDDNFGFARWVKTHEDELREGLGEGRHFGEWWGAGIQRRYDMSEKAFSLFNTSRWGSGNVPVCCRVVPVLFNGMFDEMDAQAIVDGLAASGSIASPGFMNPEGIVIYHIAANQLFKKTIAKDHEPKGKVPE